MVRNGDSMTNEEVFEFLQTLGFKRGETSADSFELKLGPIELRAGIAWFDQGVEIHGSYSGANSLADTQGMLSESVQSMLMDSSGVLPEDPSRSDVLDRIEQVLSQLPEPPVLTRLRYAISDDRLEDVRRMLSADLHVGALKLGRDRRSMLHFAKSAAMVKMLAGFGVDPNQQAMSGKTPIFDAEDPAVLHALVTAGADIKHCDHQGRAVLHLARSAKLMKYFLEAGADPNARDDAGRTPILIGHDLPALLCLLRAGADVDSQDECGGTALMLQTAADNVPLMTVLLTSGAAPDLANSNGQTAVFFVRSVGGLRLLQAFEADVHAISSEGRGVLHHCQDEGCVRMLCEQKLNPNLRDGQGLSPLHLSRSTGVARTLLQYGAEIGARDDKGRTPLHRAAARADHHVVFELLAKGADPTATDADGATALHLARSEAIAARLIRAGCDPRQPDVHGEIPLQRLEALSRRSPELSNELSIFCR